MKFQPTILILFFFLTVQFSFSQNVELSVFTIPDSLKQNANAVVRFYNTDIALESSKKMTISIKKAVTVLNKLGNDNAELVFRYDKSNHIKKIKISIYNALGVKIKDIPKRELKDYSAADGISLFNDGRLKYYEYIPTSYPYTIYYAYQYESSNTAFIRRWTPIESYTQSVQQSIYKITYPSDLKMQKVEKNFNEYLIEKDSSANSLSYKIRNALAFKYEELCPSYIHLFPKVHIAFNKFRLEGVDGTASNWKEFGKWMYDNLIVSRTEIPEATKLKVKELVKGIDDPIKKARIIYEYVQNKTRYISIQVGIGGWMPMLAKDVDRLSYGDCKALTNYTKSLLDAVGVTSYYTAVFADSPKQDMEKNVASVQGNHAFLHIPSKEKDIWLECTNQMVPFGYQGTFTDDRDVLVITPEGGILKHTGIYNDKDSFQKTVANYTIKTDGTLEGSIKISSAGIQYDDHYRLEKKSKRDIEEHYKDSYWSYINDLTIKNYHFTNNKDSIIFKENIAINAIDYATFSGDRMLFTVNAFNRALHVPKRYRNRKLPFEISRGFIDTDSFEVNLPEEYTIEVIPNAVKIENKFGLYQFSIEKISPSKLKYTRTFLLKKGFYSKDDYKKYRSFRKKIAKLDKTKIVLLKK